MVTATAAFGDLRACKRRKDTDRVEWKKIYIYIHICVCVQIPQSHGMRTGRDSYFLAAWNLSWSPSRTGHSVTLWSPNRRFELPGSEGRAGKGWMDYARTQKSKAANQYGTSRAWSGHLIHLSDDFCTSHHQSYHIPTCLAVLTRTSPQRKKRPRGLQHSIHHCLVEHVDHQRGGIRDLQTQSMTASILGGNLPTYRLNL